MENIVILGINISTKSKIEILKRISAFLNDGRQHALVTPNPEFLIEAHKNEEFFYVLNHADLAVSDGSGLTLAALFLGERLHRFPGADLVLEICRMAEREGKSIFLLGGEFGEGKEAAEKLRSFFPELKIAGAEAGLKKGKWKLERGEWLEGKAENDELLRKINAAKPDIIFTAFNHPRQEIWNFHNLPLMPSVKIAAGVGGTFNFLAGRVKRAPRIMRSLGLEWLWRLILEPWRLKRIIDAVIVFPLKFFRWRFINPHLYRQNVACLLYKKEEGKYKILILERADQAGYWQVPQGGTDGENLARAGRRELQEELNVDKIKNIKFFSGVYKYKFGNGLGKYGGAANKIGGYKGQSQSLVIAEFAGVDSDIKINFWDHSAWKWVNSENFIAELHPTRRESGSIFLEKLKEITADKTDGKFDRSGMI